MQMVTRYCIVDRQGRAWTGYEDEFSFDDDAALEYRDIDEAWEDAQQFEGVEIETFQRLSPISTQRKGSSMSSATQFRAVYDRLIDNLTTKLDALISETDASLERLAIDKFGPVSSHPDDGFGPPAKPIQVTCMHCCDRYSSSQMRRAYRPRAQAHLCEGLGEGISRITPLWWCKNDDCDGGGFGHDIQPVRARKNRKAVAA